LSGKEILNSEFINPPIRKSLNLNILCSTVHGIEKKFLSLGNHTIYVRSIYMKYLSLALLTCAALHAKSGLVTTPELTYAEATKKENLSEKELYALVLNQIQQAKITIDQDNLAAFDAAIQEKLFQQALAAKQSIISLDEEIKTLSSEEVTLEEKLATDKGAMELRQQPVAEKKKTVEEILEQKAIKQKELNTLADLLLHAELEKNDAIAKLQQAEKQFQSTESASKELGAKLTNKKEERAEFAIPKIEATQKIVKSVGGFWGLFGY